VTRLRVGVAGAGWVAGDRHLPVLLARPDVEVVAIYDRDESRAVTMARRAEAKTRNSVSTHRELDSFLAQGLDVVHVATSPWSHHRVTMGALEAGAHVFTEKPMALNLAEASEMADRSRQVGKLLCVSHNLLYSRSLRDATRSLGGETPTYVLGLQLSADTRRLPVWYRELPGGLMFDELPHMAYLLSHLLGGQLRVEHARGSRDGEGQPNTVEVLARGRRGSGQITMVFHSPVSEWHVMISSSGGIIGVDLFRDIALRLHPDKTHRSLDIARTSVDAIRGHLAGFVRAGSRWALRRQYWGHDVLIGAFLDAVMTGEPSPVALEEALSVVRFTDELLSVLGFSQELESVE
jgi:scyllo-inositol 2-dehydrogenase (NADP+)